MLSVSERIFVYSLTHRRPIVKPQFAPRRRRGLAGKNFFDKRKKRGRILVTRVLKGVIGVAELSQARGRERGDSLRYRGLPGGARRQSRGGAQLIQKPRYEYYGKEVWEAAATALLCGENLLLVGPKATGKNVLAECLACAFGRPSWDVSFYINTDAASLIGTDTFTGGEVSFRQGPITKCARLGGFGILDEINMAKNESLAVLHASLDFRRIIDVPGYDRIVMDEATRFIATMNYGYAGTRELNEALVSRFAVIDMPPISAENLKKLLKREYPSLRDEWADQLSGLFEDIRKKCDSAEISTKALDLRGLMSSVRLMHRASRRARR